MWSSVVSGLPTAGAASFVEPPTEIEFIVIAESWLWNVAQYNRSWYVETIVSSTLECNRNSEQFNPGEHTMRSTSLGNPRVPGRTHGADYHERGPVPVAQVTLKEIADGSVSARGRCARIESWRRRMADREHVEQGRTCIR
jgi:hypothetical protein